MIVLWPALSAGLLSGWALGGWLRGALRDRDHRRHVQAGAIAQLRQIASPRRYGGGAPMGLLGIVDPDATYVNVVDCGGGVSAEVIGTPPPEDDAELLGEFRKLEDEVAERQYQADIASGDTERIIPALIAHAERSAEKELRRRGVEPSSALAARIRTYAHESMQKHMIGTLPKPRP